MADDENNAKPTEAKEEGETPKKEEAQNAVEQSPQKEASEPPDSSDDNADSPEKKESPSKEPPAKSPKKEVKKEEEDDEDEESDEEDEELPPGLLEQPLQVQGKRETKKVERLSASLVPNRPEKKKIQVEEGAGVKLGDIPYIENSLNKTKAIDLKPLHRILFFRPGSNMEIKKNLRQFSGVAQGKDSKDHARRMAALNKMVSAQLKAMCLVLGLERNGTKQDILDRLEEFILKPYDRGVKVPQPKTKKRSRSKTPSSKKAKKVKTKGVKKKKKTKEQVDDDDEEDEDDEKDNDEEEEEEDEPEEEEEEEESEEEEEESEEEPPKKKKKKVVEKKKPAPKKETKQNGKKQKAAKAKPKPKNQEMSDLSDSEDDEPIANMKKPSAPDNDEIKELVKKILDGADLETVTMKTVVKQVYAKYPTFDLSDRKDFIKDTVREIIS